MINYENLSSPVLLITYRRPENTEKIINILLENNIKNIFIYNNGPIGIFDIEDCEKTKKIVEKYSKQFDNIKTLYKKKIPV